MTLQKVTFLISIVCFTFFLVLFALFFTKSDPGVVGGAIKELATLPMAILSVVFLVVAPKLAYREKFQFRSISFYSFVLLLVVVLFLLIITIIDPEIT